MSASLTIFLVVMTIVTILVISGIVIYKNKIICALNCAGKCSSVGKCICPDNWGGRFCTSCQNDYACGGPDRGKCVKGKGFVEGEENINQCECARFPDTAGVNAGKRKYVGIACEIPETGEMDYSCLKTPCPEGYLCNKANIDNLNLQGDCLKVCDPNKKNSPPNVDCLGATDLCSRVDPSDAKKGYWCLKKPPVVPK